MTSKNVSFGITLIISSTMFVVIGWVGVKILGERLPVPEIVFFRALVGSIFLFPLARFYAGSLKGKNRKLLVTRGIVGFVGMMLLFYSMTKMNLGNASVLLNTFPLFVALFAPFFLKESSTPKVFILVIIAFVGVGLILKPSMELFNIAALGGLASGIAVAFAMIAIRKLHSTDGTWVIALWFTCIITIGAIPFLLFEFVMPNLNEWLIIIAIGIIMTLSQLLMTKAYRHARADIIAPFSYLTVIWSYMCDIFIWGHTPDLWSLLGSMIVIGSGIGIILVSRKPIIRPAATS